MCTQLFVNYTLTYNIIIIHNGLPWANICSLNNYVKLFAKGNQLFIQCKPISVTFSAWITLTSLKKSIYDRL